MTTPQDPKAPRPARKRRRTPRHHNRRREAAQEQGDDHRRLDNPLLHRTRPGGRVCIGAPSSDHAVQPDKTGRTSPRPALLEVPLRDRLIGRDVFSRIIAATPNGFSIGFAVVGVALLIGISVGTFAGFRGGLFDEALMRVTDIFFAIPALILAIAIVARLGPGLVTMMFALMAVWWPAYARLSRGETLKVAHQNYIEAARTSGFGTTRIILRHVIPTSSSPSWSMPPSTWVRSCSSTRGSAISASPSRLRRPTGGRWSAHTRTT